MFSMNTKRVGRYNGTIFRFPLRQQGSNSEISRTEYTPEMIQSLLFESFKNESQHLLLFLQNVKSILLLEWKESLSTAHETFKVEVSENADDNTAIAQGTPAPLSESTMRQRVHSLRQGAKESYVEIKTMTVKVTDFSGRTTAPISHHWLVINSRGTSDPDLNTLGKKQLVLPWVGLATKLPVPVSLSACRIEGSIPHNNGELLNALFMKLEHSFRQGRKSVAWLSEAIAPCSGHVFCFLPLPDNTALPVHIHGYFAVTDNRRSIKWPAHDEKGKEAQWNRVLLRIMVAPSYALLLGCRASLIHYEKTPLPVTNTDSVTDAYSSWPQHAEVKNMRIWNELLSPMLDLCGSLPLLWTPACGGKWVQFSDACYLPGTFSSSYDCSDTVVQLLINLDVPVVSLPKSICTTITQSEMLTGLVQNQEISPQFVRPIIKGDSQCCASLTKKDVYNLLIYILNDVDESNYFALNYIPLLPLKGISQTIKFETKKSDNHKFIFTPKLRSLIDVVPGANNLIVDPEIPTNATEKLCQLASIGYFQLVEVSTQVMCKQLLPVSIQQWCGEKEGVGWKWTPGKGPMPAQSWMTALWKWIREYSVSISDLQDLPIVPLMPFDKSQEKVTLVEPQGTKSFCCICVPYGPRDKATLINILRKFNFLVADKSKMNNCDTWISEHPDLKKFIPELLSGVELVLQHLNQLDPSIRLEVVERLESSERDFLRRQFSTLYDSCAKYCECLRSLPIYHRASTRQPHFIAIDGDSSSHQAFLPPENIPPLPECPTKMLQSVVLPEEKELFKTMQVKQLSLSELCSDVLISLALQHIQSQPNSWSVGDDLVLWILKIQKLDKGVVNYLSQCEIICSRNGVHKKPRDLFDPQDQDRECNIMTLFSSEVDRGHFPHERYFTESQCRKSLLVMGMKSWKSIKKDDALLSAFLQDRMRTVSSLEQSAQLQRGALILKLLAKAENQRVLPSLVNIPFLFAESFSSHYPSTLRENWCGQKDKLYSLQELCLHNDHIQDIVGTVRPILSHHYCSSGQIEFMGALKKLPFQAITETHVLKHLKTLESVEINNEEVDKFDRIITSVYEHLHSNSCSQRLESIIGGDALKVQGSTQPRNLFSTYLIV